MEGFPNNANNLQNRSSSHPKESLEHTSKPVQPGSVVARNVAVDEPVTTEEKALSMAGTSTVSGSTRAKAKRALKEQGSDVTVRG